MTDWRILDGDCRDVLRGLDADSVDAVVTDPPYGLGFMGKGWDHGVPGAAFWSEILRVMKPGAPLLAFGGTRTYHRLAVAIEDAGAEIRDCLAWMYGSGFPKSLDVSKAIDAAALFGGSDSRRLRARDGRTVGSVGTNMNGHRSGRNDEDEGAAALPVATDLARRWSGYGTALKPAWEPIILARRPLAGTVAANVAAHGVGGLAIDACRIGRDVGDVSGWSITGSKASENRAMSGANYHRDPKPDESGRWPANVLLDEDAAAALDAQSGQQVDGVAVNRNRGEVRPATVANVPSRVLPENVGYGGKGGASRFFYTAKASSADRGDGNDHPTVKPRDLMRYLCRLVLPPRGPDDDPPRLLDPFAGSGSTILAALDVGFDATGVELDPHYARIARQRIVADAPLFRS